MRRIAAGFARLGLIGGGGAVTYDDNGMAKVTINDHGAKGTVTLRTEHACGMRGARRIVGDATALNPRARALPAPHPFDEYRPLRQIGADVWLADHVRAHDDASSYFRLHQRCNALAAAGAHHAGSCLGGSTQVSASFFARLMSYRVASPSMRRKLVGTVSPASHASAQSRPSPSLTSSATALPGGSLSTRRSR
jgi:hypothetical protein